MKYQSGELDDLGLFVAVVDAGGFTAAARSLGASKAFVSRRVQELERRLGVRLLERTTRDVRLTESGSAVYDRARQAVALAAEARSVVDAARREPTGLLRLTTTQLLAELILRPIVLEYLRRYPHVAVELDISSRAADIVREGFDVAVRAGVVSDSSLVGRVIGKGRTVYVAAPAFLKSVPSLREPKDLERVAAITIAGGAAEWSFQRGRRRLAVRPSVRLTTPSYTLAREAAIAGIGVARLPGYFVADDVAAQRLEPVLTEWTPPEVPITAVYPSRDLQPMKTSAFISLLVEHVRKQPLPTT